jgi:hypothetical protein
LCVFSLAAALIAAGSDPALLGLVLIPAFVFLVTPLHRVAIRVTAAAGRSRPPSTRAPPIA